LVADLDDVSGVVVGHDGQELAAPLVGDLVDAVAASSHTRQAPTSRCRQRRREES
jgi:hypothetical protein